MRLQTPMALSLACGLLALAVGAAAAEVSPPADARPLAIVDAPPPIFARDANGVLKPGAREFADRLIAEARTQGTIRVIVGLDSPPYCGLSAQRRKMMRADSITCGRCRIAYWPT